MVHPYDADGRQTGEALGNGSGSTWVYDNASQMLGVASGVAHIGVASIKATIAADAVAGQDAGHEPGVATESGSGRVYMF